MWPSLGDQIALAYDLFGDRGRRLVAAWLDREVSRVDDPEFARGFSDHIELPGVTASDYNHRLLRTAAGDLLGGIRFYGRDISRPFIEVVGHGFTDLDALSACVRAEWAEFTPRFLRLHARPGAVSGPKVLLDKSIHVARYRDTVKPRCALTLAPFDSAADAAAMVAARYAALAADAPHLRRNLAPASADELAGLHEAGRLRAARLGGTTVGLLAVAPGAISWIDGDEIMEEVVDVRFAGRGLAAAMQGAWAHSVVADADRLLIGSIDRHNIASRRSAERAGRPAVLESVFVDLSDAPATFAACPCRTG